MKLFICNLLIVAFISVTNSFGVDAQERELKSIKKKVQTRVSERLRHKDRAVTVIKPEHIFKSSALKLKVGAVKKKPAMKIKAGKVSNPTPRPNTQGSIKAAPPGKLKIMLTPKTPARNKYAYMNYEYPREVRLNDNSNYAEFSKNNVPGRLTFRVNLKKGNKYLIEAIVEGSAGELRYSLGGDVSFHDMSGPDKVNLTRIVQLSESGWINGYISQSDLAPTVWSIFSVKITEMD